MTCTHGAGSTLQITMAQAVGETFSRPNFTSVCEARSRSTPSTSSIHVNAALTNLAINYLICQYWLLVVTCEQS
jgi:hypothetical protein